jgi:hypothetical protein
MTIPFPFPPFVLRLLQGPAMDFARARALLHAADLTRAAPAERPLKVQGCLAVTRHVLHCAGPGPEFGPLLGGALRLLLRVTRDAERTAPSISNGS